jgi:hypothetical protein
VGRHDAGREHETVVGRLFKRPFGNDAVRPVAQRRVEFPLRVVGLRHFGLFKRYLDLRGLPAMFCSERYIFCESRRIELRIRSKGDRGRERYGFVARRQVRELQRRGAKRPGKVVGQAIAFEIR